jgi:hypothetical protein
MKAWYFSSSKHSHWEVQCQHLAGLNLQLGIDSRIRLQHLIATGTFLKWHNQPTQQQGAGRPRRHQQQQSQNSVGSPNSYHRTPENSNTQQHTMPSTKKGHPPAERWHTSVLASTRPDGAVP